MKLNRDKHVISGVKVVSVVYFLLLGYVTFFSRRRTGFHNFRDYTNFRLMHKLSAYTALDVRGKFFFIEDIIGNVVIFIPFVMALSFIFPKKRTNKKLLFLVLLTTLSIECIQYMFEVGVFDVDDILLNLTGGVLGIYLFNLIRRKYIV